MWMELSSATKRIVPENSIERYDGMMHGEQFDPAEVRPCF